MVEYNTGHPLECRADIHGQQDAVTSQLLKRGWTIDAEAIGARIRRNRIRNESCRLWGTIMSGACLQRLLTCCALGLALLSGPALADDLQRKIDDCAEVENDDDRLGCFDALASRDEESYAPAGNEAAAVTPVTTAATIAEPESTSKDEEAPETTSPIIAPARSRDEEKEKEVFDVRLTRCSQTSASGRQVYYLDNGEVWRQSNNSRNNVRNCDTPVTIRKDLFGYKMEVPSENRSIRISPVR